jgi:probable F420-dependent oxidoreductase
MRLGATFPQLEIGTDPDDIATWAREVERLGYEHVMVYDHVLGADATTRPGWRGYTSDDSFHEVFVLLGYLAALTSRVELAIGVLVLPQRQTALAAKQAAEVDVLSGGRLRLGVGIGWNRVEYESLGTDFSNRGARIEEQIALLRALWAEPVVTFRGRWESVIAAGLNPLPVRRRIPIWIGGSAEPVLRRIGRIGDGWFPQRDPDAPAAAMMARIQDYAAQAGRARDDVGFEARINLGEVPRAGWGDFVAGWRGLGATHLGVNTMGLGLHGVADHLEVLGDVVALTRGQ